MSFRMCLAAACLLAAQPAAASAAPDYDPSLQEAATRLAVSRLGPLREGFGLGEQPRYVRSAPERSQSRDDGAATWQDGLAPATDLPREGARP